MPTSCTDCDALAQARNEHHEAVLAFMFAGITFVAAFSRALTAKRRVAEVQLAQTIELVDAVVLVATSADAPGGETDDLAATDEPAP